MKVSSSDVNCEIVGIVNSLMLSGVDFFVSSIHVLIVANNSLSVLHGMIFFSFSGSTFSGMNLICTVTPAIVSPVCLESFILVECNVILHWPLYNAALDI